MKGVELIAIDVSAAEKNSIRVRWRCWSVSTPRPPAGMRAATTGSRSDNGSGV